MAGIVLDANAVGQVITYVAPGYLAYFGYRLRYPGPDRPAGEVLIISVVTSLPLVALVTALLPGAQKPSQVGYVALLLALALVLGYLGALARGTKPIKRFLGWLGYRTQPESSIYAQTLYHLPDAAPVLIELQGRPPALGLHPQWAPAQGRRHQRALPRLSAGARQGRHSRAHLGRGRHRALVGGGQHRALRGPHRRAA